VAYVEHKIEQDRSIPTVASALVRENLPVLGMFQTWAPDKYFGQDGGKVNLKVPGALPARKYPWRNDRRKPIVVDTYEETTISLDVGQPENHYSAVELTDEQKEYDLQGSFGELTGVQTTAIVNELNRQARDWILEAPYEFGLGVDLSDNRIVEAREMGQDAVFNAFVDARNELNRLGVPHLGRSMLVGSDVAALLIKNAKLDKIQGNNTPHIFAEAELGNYAGFTIVEDTQGLVEPDEAMAFDASGFLFWSYAPAIPESAIRGARTNKDGIGLRWVVDYDPAYMIERSVWNSWNAFGYAEDFVIGFDTNGDRAVGTEQYFVKGLNMKFFMGSGEGAGEAAEDWTWKPGDGKDIDNGRKGAAPDSELARWTNFEPIRDGRDFVPRYMPSVLQGDVQIGEQPGSGADSGN
jgi:hypothetical protein